jgi:DNA ligase-associated metallophosphoesterase
MIPKAKSINLNHQRLWLLPQKAIYWQKKKTLLIADLHIGKSGYFRSNGIPVPQQVNTENFKILNALIRQLTPEQIIFLGDLFHSHINEEWNQFRAWRSRHPGIEVTLIIGNHDILPRKEYHASHISVFKRLKMDPFYFVHDVESAQESLQKSSLYLLGGHIHPALQLKGKGRQSMKFPCFYFGDNHGVLPAFGEFTGTAVIQPPENERAYIVVDDHIMAASTHKDQ